VALFVHATEKMEVSRAAHHKNSGAACNEERPSGDLIEVRDFVTIFSVTFKHLLYHFDLSGHVMLQVIFTVSILLSTQVKIGLKNEVVRNAFNIGW
jgi:hypothetical protein